MVQHIETGEKSDSFQQQELDGYKPLVLSAEQKAAMAQKASSGIVHALCAQALMGVVAVTLAFLVSGVNAAASALLGAAAYFVPNALFALRLLLGLFGGGSASPMAFFWGEAFKLTAALLILGLAATTNTGWLSWPALLFGLVCVLKGYVLLLALRKLP